MTEEQLHAESHDRIGNPERKIGDQNIPIGNPKKKKASWMRTILWMLSMILLVNVFFVILAYILHHFKII